MFVVIVIARLVAERLSPQLYWLVLDHHAIAGPMPAPTLPSKGSSNRHDMSVILVTGSYDHEIRFWEAWSGICSRTIARTGESGVSTKLPTD